MVTMRKCPICGNMVKNEFPNEICPNCGWEEDWYQEKFPNEKDQANKMSLNEARKAYERGEKII